MKLIITVILLLTTTTGCVNKDQIYEGMYKGVGAAEQNRRTENPSYNPSMGSEQAQPEYHEYKAERQKILEKNDSVANEVK